jgi:hypothetical protein
MTGVQLRPGFGKAFADVRAGIQNTFGMNVILFECIERQLFLERRNYLSARFGSTAIPKVL